MARHGFFLSRIVDVLKSAFDTGRSGILLISGAVSFEFVVSEPRVYYQLAPELPYLGPQDCNKTFFLDGLDLGKILDGLKIRYRLP